MSQSRLLEFLYDSPLLQKFIMHFSSEFMRADEATRSMTLGNRRAESSMELELKMNLRDSQCQVFVYVVREAIN